MMSPYTNPSLNPNVALDAEVVMLRAILTTLW